MILGCDSGAKQGHDAVTHTTGDLAAEPCHGLADDVNHGAQRVARVFRIHLGDQRRGAADVRKQNRDMLQLGARRV